MNIIEIYLNNARKFLDHGYALGAKGCIISAYEITKETGFDTEEQRDLFLSLFNQIKEVTE